MRAARRSTCGSRAEDGLDRARGVLRAAGARRLSAAHLPHRGDGRRARRAVPARPRRALRQRAPPARRRARRVPPERRRRSLACADAARTDAAAVDAAADAAAERVAAAVGRAAAGAPAAPSAAPVPAPTRTRHADADRLGRAERLARADRDAPADRLARAVAHVRADRLAAAGRPRAARTRPPTQASDGRRDGSARKAARAARREQSVVGLAGRRAALVSSARRSTKPIGVSSSSSRAA